MHLSSLLLLSSAFIYCSASSAATCLELFYKVVVRNATTLETQELTYCFERIPDLHDRLSSLTPDIEDFATKCFGDFAKFARGHATPKQISRLPVCGWDTVKILHELFKSDDNLLEIPLNAPMAALMSKSGEAFASQCLQFFGQAITGPKSGIEIEALNLCGAKFLKKTKYAVDRYIELTLQEGPSVTRKEVESALDSMEDMATKCLTHFIGVLTGTEEAREGSLAYCGGVFMTTTRLFVDLALGRDPLQDQSLN